jgi:small GTP-binding protein
MNNNDDDYDMIFKLVLIGDSGVGKSNIISRYVRNEFKVDTKTTVGVEFGAKKVEVGGLNIKAQIWDTAGQERYRAVTCAYYKGAKGALLVYDITNLESFTNIDKWIRELKNNTDENISIIIIGNKSDLEKDRVIPMETAQTKAAQYGRH